MVGIMLIKKDMSRVTPVLLYSLTGAVVLSCIFPMLIYNVVGDRVLRIVLVVVGSFISTSTVIYYVGCTSNERAFVKSKIRKLFKKK